MLSYLIFLFNTWCHNRFNVFVRQKCVRLFTDVLASVVSDTVPPVGISFGDLKKRYKIVMMKGRKNRWIFVIMAHYAFICATQKKAPASCALVLRFSILLKHHNTDPLNPLMRKRDLFSSSYWHVFLFPFFCFAPYCVLLALHKFNALLFWQ